jgi:pimeloyl-ACP methyl ester carboxylesterase
LSLAFQSFGQGPPVIFLHGLFGSGDNLRVLSRGLESNYTVFLPDLLNHGDSPHSADATQLAMAEAVEAFVAEHSLSRPVVAGHSIGGKVAMLVALRARIDTAALVSIDMSPRRYQPSHTEIIAAMRSLPVGEIHSRREADEHMKRAVPNAAVRAFLLKNLVRRSERYVWRLNIDAIDADYPALLGWNPPDAVFTGPALFVGGERSSYFQEGRDRADIARWFPQAELHTIPNAGHWLHADKPEELLEILRDFLRSLELG